jgi:hypothetical protein
MDPVQSQLTGNFPMGSSKTILGQRLALFPLLILALERKCSLSASSVLIVQRGYFRGTIFTTLEGQAVILSAAKDLAAAFSATVITTFLVVLGPTLCYPLASRKIAQRNAPSEILRCARDDGALSPYIICFRARRG